MKVTEVRVYPDNHEDLRGYASITLDNCWMVRDLRIIQNESGWLYVGMPRKKQHDGTYREIAFPVTTEARQLIEEAVLAEYRKIIGERERKAS